MDSIINLQKKIVPELTNLLVQRYQILRQVSHEHPIGRRALAARLGLSERVLRAQVDFLKGCGLLVFSSSGMTVTEEGMDAWIFCGSLPIMCANCRGLTLWSSFYAVS